MSASHLIAARDIRELIHFFHFSLLDGGTGEELFRRGVPDDRKIWSARAVVDAKYHECLRHVHRSFLEAGACGVTTNSFGIVPGVGFGGEEIIKYCAIAGRIARESTEGYEDRFVFGSLGPLVESYRADLVMKHEDGVAFYKQMISALGPFVDCFLAETLSSVEESMQPIDALAQSEVDKCILVSYSLCSNGRLRDGETPESGIPRLLKYAHERNVKGE